MESQEDASYVCHACGESIVVPIDVSQGSRQDYVEDCPVCCRANVIHARLQSDGEFEIWSEAED